MSTLNSVKNLFLSAMFLLNIALTQDVSIGVGNVTFPGYTDDLVVPITVTNPNNSVGGIQFDVNVSPSMVMLSGVSTYGTAESNFNADYSILNNGNARVVFYDANGSSGLPPNSDDHVMNLHFSGSEVLSAVLEVEIGNVVVSDNDGVILTSMPASGSLTIGDVIYLNGSTNNTADVTEMVDIEFSIENSGPVGGVQFDISDSPNYLNLMSVSTTDRTTGFTVNFSDVDNGSSSRIVLYSQDNNNLAAGQGPVLVATFQVIETAYADTVSIFIDNVIVTDGIGGSYWIASADSGSVEITPGYIEPPSNLQAVDGQDAQVLLTWDPPSGPIPDDISEDFESGIPADWTLTTNSAQGWYLTTDCTSDFWTVPAHTSYMCANDDAANDDGSVDYMITPSLNVSGAANVTLNFASYFDGAYGQTASIGVSEDGINFTEVYPLAVGTAWVIESVDLTESITGDNLYILFHANDNGAWASGWAVDDVSISFASRNSNRITHYELTDMGEWVVNAPKEEVIAKYAGGIPFVDRIDIDNPVMQNVNDRPVNISAYKVYRSLNSDTGFEEIAEVGGTTTQYLDLNVVNSTTYYYYVTAIYPDGTPSTPTNTVAAGPVEWVEISMSDGQSLSGQTDTIDVYINNESLVGGVVFEIEDFPDIISSQNILETERSEGWVWTIFDNSGKISVSGLGVIANAPPIQPGNGPICRMVLRPIADQATNVTMTFTDVTITDINSVDLNWTSETASYDVMIETQYLMITDGVTSPGQPMSGSMCLINTQPVYGIEVEFEIEPAFVEGTGVQLTNLIDFSTWSVSSQHLGNTFTVLLYDNTLSTPIPAGYWYLGEVFMSPVGGAPTGQVINVQYGDITISDSYTNPMVAVGLESEVYIGQPPALFTIENVMGTLASGGTGSFEVHMNNTETVGTMAFKIEDVPSFLSVTSVEKLGRFEAGGTIQTAEEDEEGYFDFVGYELASGIAPGSGPILKVNVQMGQNIDNPNVMLFFNNLAAGDATANPLDAASDGLGLFTTSTLSNDISANLPESYKLHSNYPNPFNPSTFIAYDLAADGQVDLSIYDIVGRKVKTIVSGYETAGKKTAIWYGTDESGNSLSAGMYFYRLTVSGNVFTKKMILMK